MRAQHPPPSPNPPTQRTPFFPQPFPFSSPPSQLSFLPSPLSLLPVTLFSPFFLSLYLLLTSCHSLLSLLPVIRCSPYFLSFSFLFAFFYPFSFFPFTLSSPPSCRHSLSTVHLYSLLPCLSLLLTSFPSLFSSHPSKKLSTVSFLPCPFFLLYFLSLSLLLSLQSTVYSLPSLYLRLTSFLFPIHPPPSFLFPTHPAPLTFTLSLRLTR